MGICIYPFSLVIFKFAAIVHMLLAFLKWFPFGLWLFVNLLLLMFISFCLHVMCRGLTFTSTLRSGAKERKRVLHLSIGTWRTKISLNHEN